MSRQWFPHYIGDYMRDTGHLTLVEDGAYRRLLDYYYSSGKPLTSCKNQLRRICRAFEDEEKIAIDTVLKQFFTLKDGEYHNKRADNELKKHDDLSKKNSENAAKRWDRERNATALRTHKRPPCQTDASTTTTTSTSITTPKPQPERVLYAGAHADLVNEIIGCREEFKRLKPESIATEIHKAKGNERYIKNAAEFIADAANLLEPPKNPIAMLRAYLNREGKQHNKSLKSGGASI